MIHQYVADDPTAFYKEDEFTKGYETLKKFCNLRAESIRKQLNGEIPSTSEGQSAEGVTLVNADSIKISDMGTQNHGNNKMSDKKNEKK